MKPRIQIKNDTRSEGYHAFKDLEDEAKDAGFGCFEVFWHGATYEWKEGPGWFWWPCFPGCLPEDEPSGPFPTAEAAYKDAQS